MKVNFILYTCMVIGCFFATDAENVGNKELARIYEEPVNATCECIRDLLIQGLEEEGIPSFNPLEIDELSIDFTSFGELGELHLNNITLDGITGWELKTLDIKLNIIGGIGATITADLNFPNLKLHTDFDCDVTVSDVHVWGKGNITAELGHFLIQLDTKAVLNRLYLDHIKILPALESFNIKFTGLFDDELESQLVSQLLNEIVVDWVNEKGPDMSDVLEQIIMELVNGAAGVTGGGEEKNIINIILEKCPLELGK